MNPEEHRGVFSTTDNNSAQVGIEVRNFIISVATNAMLKVNQGTYVPCRLTIPIFWNLEIRFDIFSKLMPLMHLENFNIKR